MEKNREGVSIIFGEEIPHKWLQSKRVFSEILAKEALRQDIEKMGFKFSPIEQFIEAGSIYEASAFVEELSHLKFSKGTSLTKSIEYKGYELWWVYYNNLFTFFCLPFTQYKKLLGYLKDFRDIYIYQSPYKTLFSYYLQSHGCEMHIIRENTFKSSPILPFGVFIQIIITFLYLPVLFVNKHRFMLFIGDKFEKNKDFDFRMRFIYRELRQRKLLFVEFIRSLESWTIVLQHFFVRKRPVVYSEAIIFLGRFSSFLTGGHRRARQKFGTHNFVSEKDPETRFKFLIATHYLRDVYSDIWAIRIMKWILSTIGVKSALFTAVLDRNFHAFAGCKLNKIPTIGILHGVASQYYNVYDFMPGFRGKKTLSVDKYGLWSEWWREYYLKNSKAYKPEQLFVSGPMRPLEGGIKKPTTNNATATKKSPIKVLFVSEQLAVPFEILPFLEVLLNQPGIEITFTFRHYRDGFRDWLTEHNPDLLNRKDIKITQLGLQEAISNNDVVVGTHSTAVLEALFQYKVPIFFQTKKWGDYYGFGEYDDNHSFFAEDPGELIKKIKDAPKVSINELEKLRERYFGDPYMNGSKWAVNQLEGTL